MAMYLGSNKVEIGVNNGGGSLAPLICTESEDGYLDKTFGELRTALLNGVTIIVQKTQDFGESATGVHIEVLISITYTIDEGSGQAYGDIYCYSMSYTVLLEEAPYTIEALDALYPHVPDVPD